MQQSFICSLLLVIIITHSLLLRSTAQPYDYPSANLSTKWTNNPSIQHHATFNDGVTVRSILLRGTFGPAFACGFVCSGSCKSFLFSIFIVYANSSGGITGFTYASPQIVWSANRDRPVRENATLDFSENGDLTLRDFDGSEVWSSNTAGKSVIGMDINKVGTLILFDDKNQTVWSSIDYPTDSLVLGQTLREGLRLTANASITNSSQGQLYLSVVRGGFRTFVGSQMYFENICTNPGQKKATYGYENICTNPGQKKATYVSFNNGSLDTFSGASAPDFSLPLPLASSVQYMQLDYGGHLRIYEWQPSGWALVGNAFDLMDDCSYPTVCGEYGVCSDGQCTCPASANNSLTYFRPINQWNPKDGCMPINAISCKPNKSQEFLLLQNVTYFSYFSYFGLFSSAAADMNNTTAEGCKQACLANCSCKAALFQYDQNASSGNCYLPSQLYSLAYNLPEIAYYDSFTFIKVQSFPVTDTRSKANSSNFSESKKVSPGVIVGATVGSLAAIFIAAVCIIVLVRRRNTYREVEDDVEFNMLPGLPTRFTFEDLRIATNGFIQKLGEGGFGSVFEGTLIDGGKIAVKRLDGVGQGKKEFLAEVQTIGNIHHLHLVRLVGFCAEKSYRLLVYEYMPNGSLDKWIYYRDRDTVLEWKTRRKIITDIAKGLAYLHEDCRQKIVHLDIKPQNILLDENFDAKVSDFGLAKLIDRDQSQVMTGMRGTLGYLAPEWLTSVITEKVDVFSFGIVVLEIVCGRKNLDYSKDEESVHLVTLLQQKAKEKRLHDIVDSRSSDMRQSHSEDVNVIMHLAMWCLQNDGNKRPSMSVVVKVLEGSMEVEANLDYNFCDPSPYVPRNVNIIESVRPVASSLSGPR